MSRSWGPSAGVPGPNSAENHALAERAFSQGPCTVAIYDMDLRVVRANADMERAVARTEDRMRGLRLPEIVVHPSSERVERAMREVLDRIRPRPGRALRRSHPPLLALPPLFGVFPATVCRAVQRLGPPLVVEPVGPRRRGPSGCGSWMAPSSRRAVEAGDADVGLRGRSSVVAAAGHGDACHAH